MTRHLRLFVVPAILFAVVAGAVFGLAQWHPAKPEESRPAAAGPGTPASRGDALFDQHCASCHETGVGPELAGNPISLAAARTQIENGGGGMPADLVTGRDLEDMLAYLETILGST